jgi:transposase-like protein
MRDGDKTIHGLNAYYDDYPEKAIAFLAQGKSYAALAAYLDVSQQTLDNWRKRYPEFDDAVARGKDKGQAWWEQDGDSNIQNKNYNATMYIFKMKSQYRVRDGSEAKGMQFIGAVDASKNADAQELIDKAVAEAKARGEFKD